MTPKQQQIAIAEACGWKRIPKDNVGAAARLFYGAIWWRDAENNTIASPDQLPDYLNDLNAMHEAEKVLKTFEQKTQYVWELERLTDWKPLYNIGGDGQQYISPSAYWCVTIATAAQRAEAFLKTLNLWTP